MKLSRKLLLIIFFLASLVPTELFHYVHVVNDFSEHYQHHKTLDFSEFINHALSERGKDKDHPEHNHSPFQHHCSFHVSFISVLPTKIAPSIEFISFYSESKEYPTMKSCEISEVSLAIWQPPKLV